MNKLFILLIVEVLFLSCSNRFQALRTQYQFKSPDGNPDYSQLNYWAAHPWKKDPSDSVPAPLKNEHKDSLADVFFLHPTTFTEKKFAKNLNASIDDDYLNAKTDYTSILFQASVFNRQCRVFAPRYRQAHIVNFFSKDKESASKAFDRAYNDLKTAFEYYLKTWNHERPIIIASHSQGSLLAERLLKEFFENKPLLSKLVVVYVLGWPVLNDYFSNLKMCEDSLETGCLCSWRTFRKGYIPSYMRANKNIVAGGNAFFNNHSFVTNPLNWKTTSEYASKKMNKGSVLTKFNNIYFHTTDAQIGNGLLYVKKPKFPWSFLYFRKNYHIADINLFYLNIRENLQQRIVSYLKKNQ